MGRLWGPLVAVLLPTIAFAGGPTNPPPPQPVKCADGSAVTALGYGIATTCGAGGGGGAVSVTAATPNLVVTPSPGTGTFTLGTSNPQNAPADDGSHSYTVLSGDLVQEVVLVNTFTGLAVPQATGSFAAGASFSAVTQSAVTATSTTSTVNGIAGGTGIKLAANQYSQWDAFGGNWLVGLGLPQPATQTGTTFLRDDMTWASLPTVGGANSWTGAQTFAAVLGAENDQSGASYTLLATDCGKTVAFSNAGAVTVTIPAAIVPAAGTTCNVAIRQDGAGQVRVDGTAVSAATLVSAHSYTKTFGQHAVVGLELTTISATTTAVLTGDGA